MKDIAVNAQRIAHMARRGGMETDGPEIRLGITNCGTELMEIVLEPLGEDYWLKPDESVTIIAVGRVDGTQTWRGNTTNAPFDINYYPALMAVYCNGAYAWVVDDDGNELECGYQRPEPPPAAPKPSFAGMPGSTLRPLQATPRRGNRTGVKAHKETEVFLDLEGGEPELQSGMLVGIQIDFTDAHGSRWRRVDDGQPQLID